MEKIHYSTLLRQIADSGVSFEDMNKCLQKLEQEYKEKAEAAARQEALTAAKKKLVDAAVKYAKLLDSSIVLSEADINYIMDQYTQLEKLFVCEKPKADSWSILNDWKKSL